MNIQTKAVLIIASVFAALALAFSMITRTLILDGFLVLERSFVLSDTKCVENVLEVDLDGINRLLVDWAMWDDSYEFMKSGEEAYIESNLTADTFPGLELDAMLYLKYSGEVVFAKQYDGTSGELIDASASLMQHFTPTSTLLSLKAEEDVKVGFIRADESIYFIGASPVLQSDGSGKPQGIMAMATRIDEKYIESISSLLRLNISVLEKEDIQKAEDPNLIETIQSNGGFYQKIVDDNNITGYGIIPDLYGKPAIVYRVDVDRPVYRKGKAMYQYIFYAKLIAVVIFALMTIFLVRKLVIDKINDITNDLKKMQYDIESAGRIEALGSDEIGELSSAINDLLEQFRKSAEGLNRAREKAERKNSAKAEFLSQLSHELHTPLNAILGYAQLCSDDIEPEKKDNLRQILHAGEHLLGLINELLDSSKLELGHYEINLETVDLIEVTTAAISMVYHFAEERSVQILESDLKEDFLVKADKSRLRQVLVNLLSNGIKYNHADGKVWIEFEKIDPDRIRIKIRDNGQGIAPEMQDKIFEPYERGQAALTSIPGSGIGLHLCKDLIEAMSGRIGCDSEHTKGSTFWVELPMA